MNPLQTAARRVSPRVSVRHDICAWQFPPPHTPPPPPLRADVAMRLSCSPRRHRQKKKKKKTLTRRIRRWVSLNRDEPRQKNDSCVCKCHQHPPESVREGDGGLLRKKKKKERKKERKSVFIHSRRTFCQLGSVSSTIETHAENSQIGLVIYLFIFLILSLLLLILLCPILNGLCSPRRLHNV